MNQFTSFERGTLNGPKTGLAGTATRSQTWDFDALGNFDSQSTDWSERVHHMSIFATGVKNCGNRQDTGGTSLTA